MDKKTATLTLTEKLNELRHVNLVFDPAIKSYLLDNAKSVVFNTQKSDKMKIIYTDYAYPSYFEPDKIKRDGLPHPLKEFNWANYFFAQESHGSYKFLITPVALIGEVEEKVLKEIFYKNVPDKIVKAFEVLKLHHFIKQYESYSSLSDISNLSSLASPFLYNYIPFENGMVVEVGDIIQGKTSKNYYLVENINRDGAVVGRKFYDALLENSCEGDNHSVCPPEYIIPFRKKFPESEFLNFIFNLPYEDQNIEVNKALLKNYAYNVDLCKVMLKEYSEGKYFKDYFPVLNEGYQKKVVENIIPLSNQDKFLNSWLFNQGFDVEMDYLELYKKDTKGFINYFRKSNDHIQELIVSDLFSCDHVNDEVIGFLEKDYSHLLRDVSFKNEALTKSG